RYTPTPSIIAFASELRTRRSLVEELPDFLLLQSSPLSRAAVVCARLAPMRRRDQRVARGEDRHCDALASGGCRAGRERLPAALGMARALHRPGLRATLIP